MSKIASEIQDRILVLDGAMGTMLQAYNFTEEDFRGERFKDYPSPLKGNNDLLSITQPKAIAEIHAKYFEAGADIVETNTFSGTRIAMEDYQMQDLVYELNFESARIAKQVANTFTAENINKPRFVAGSIGPTNKTASLSPDVNRPEFRAITFNELRVAYKEQVEALIDGGVDLLLVETIFDTLNAKAALFAIEEVKEELFVSFGRNEIQQTPEETPNEQKEQERQDKIKAIQQIRLEKQRLTAKYNKERSDFEKRPKREYLSPSTKRSESAAYLVELVEKINRVGNLNFPSEIRNKKLSGTLVADLALNRNGTINNIKVLKSSGNALLDKTAVDFIRIASPYKPFTDNMLKEDTNIIHITRTYIFSPNYTISSQAVKSDNSN